jgi:hypothetical protein
MWIVQEYLLINKWHIYHFKLKGQIQVI